MKLQSSPHRFYGKPMEGTKMNLLDAKRARFVARVGGVLYFIIIALGALGEAAVRGSIVVPGNATAKSINS